MKHNLFPTSGFCVFLALAWPMSAPATDGAGAPGEQAPPKKSRQSTPASAVKEPLSFPPRLPGGQIMVTDSSRDFLKPTPTIKSEVEIAQTPPTVDFMFYPGQDYPGKPWSNWGDSLVINGKYYSSIGDHLALGSKGDLNHSGNAFVFEYDPATKRMRQLVEVRKVLNQPVGHYTPGKIHGRLDLGSDGWLYFSTHRGSATATKDTYHYKGDWIIRHHPTTGASEVVAAGPVPKHCIPCSVLDPERLIFYGGTAAGDADDESTIRFFAYDVKNRKLLYSGPDGPARSMIFVRSTGKVYYTPGSKEMTGTLMCYDPAKGGPPVATRTRIGLRAATEETPQGFVYTTSKGSKGTPSTLWAFNTKTEEAENLGDPAVGRQDYITTMDADPTGRYVYYMPGAHGRSEDDGTPVVQYDVQTKRKKVIAFLAPYYKEKYGCTLTGTFSSALDAKGETLYVSWNVIRGEKNWDSVALTVIHIPRSERRL